MHSSPQASIGFKMLAASMAPSVLPAPRIKWHSPTNRKSDLRPFCTYPALLSTTLQVLICTWRWQPTHPCQVYTKPHPWESRVSYRLFTFLQCRFLCLSIWSYSCAYGSLAPSQPGPPPRPTSNAAVLTASHNYLVLDGTWEWCLGDK